MGKSRGHDKKKGQVGKKEGKVGPAGKPTQSKRTLTRSLPFVSKVSILWYSKLLSYHRGL